MTLHACPDCTCADPPPQPGSSNDRHRRALMAGVAAVIDSNRRTRTTVTKESEK